MLPQQPALQVRGAAHLGLVAGTIQDAELAIGVPCSAEQEAHKDQSRGGWVLAADSRSRKPAHKDWDPPKHTPQQAAAAAAAGGRATRGAWQAASSTAAMLLQASPHQWGRPRLCLCTASRPSTCPRCHCMTWWAGGDNRASECGPRPPHVCPRVCAAAPHAAPLPACLPLPPALHVTFQIVRAVAAVALESAAVRAVEVGGGFAETVAGVILGTCRGGGQQPRKGAGVHQHKLLAAGVLPSAMKHPAPLPLRACCGQQARRGAARQHRGGGQAPASRQAPLTAVGLADA